MLGHPVATAESRTWREPRRMSRRHPLELLLQTPRGELIGVVKLLERFRMTFEVASPMRPGDAVDFRILLPDDQGDEAPLEIRGTVRVVRVIDAHHDAPTLFSGEIIDVRKDDLPELDAWLALHSSSQGRRFEALSESSEFDPDVDISDPGSNLTDPLDPLDLPARAFLDTISSAPYGFSEDTDHADLRVAGREAIRSALRRGLQTRSGRSHGVPGRPVGRDAWLRQTRERARRQARAWVEDEGSPLDLGSSEDPSVLIDADRSPILVTVRWRSAARYRDDFVRHLKGGGIFVPTKEPLPRQAAVELHLHLPSGEQLSCAAVVVAPMPTGAGMSIKLTPANVALLAQEG